VFHVRAAAGSWELKDEEEIDAFLEELASLPFSPVINEVPEQSEAGELYVFSTACDTALPAFLLSRQGPVSLFMVQPQVKADNKSAECASLRLRDFQAGGSVPHLRWFLPRRERQLHTGGKVMAEASSIDYAEIRL
jgi:hypothetical protein